MVWRDQGMPGAKQEYYPAVITFEVARKEEWVFNKGNLQWLERDFRRQIQYFVWFWSFFWNGGLKSSKSLGNETFMIQPDKV